MLEGVKAMQLQIAKKPLLIMSLLRKETVACLFGSSTRNHGRDVPLHAAAAFAGLMRINLHFYGGLSGLVLEVSPTDATAVNAVCAWAKEEHGPSCIIGLSEFER